MTVTSALIALRDPVVLVMREPLCSCLEPPEEQVGVLLGERVGPEPSVRPVPVGHAVHGRQDEDGGDRGVGGLELAGGDALADDPLEVALVGGAGAGHGQEDLGPVASTGHHSHVGADHGPQALRGRPRPVRDRPHGGVEAVRRLLDDGGEHRLLGGDVGVEAAALQVEGLGDVAHAGGRVAAVAEQGAGHVLDLAPASLHAWLPN